MLNLYKSNHMETLLEGFCDLLKQVPDDPMTPEWISVQSRGMKQWIEAQTALNLGISANMQFWFPRQVIDLLLSAMTPLADTDQELSRETIFWSVMTLFNRFPAEKTLSPIHQYLKGEQIEKKQCQLAAKIAEVMDDYQIYRPGMLLKWQKRYHGSPASSFRSKNSEETWQTWLWQQLVSGSDQHHLPFRIMQIINSKNQGGTFPETWPARISFFGISSLPPVFIDLLSVVSLQMDINFFLLTPSGEYFFDIPSPKQMGRISLKEDTAAQSNLLHYDTGNPLLASMGATGRDFLSHFESYHYHEPAEHLFSNPLDRSDTMLSYLQSDILNLIHRGENASHPPVNVAPADTSVSIHACHSPMREVQVLKDLLLEALEIDTDLSPHDIMVMMPDVEAYAPFIGSVFSSGTPLPFSISDRKKRSGSEVIDGFLKILALKTSRMEPSIVLDLLLLPSIALKFDISFEDVSLIEKIIRDAGILWGKDETHRQDLHLPPFRENTWMFGLDRLFMGMAMPENRDRLSHGVLASQPLEGSDLAVLGQLAHFCHTLFTCLESLDGSKTIDQWCAQFNDITFSFIEEQYQYREDLTFLLQAISQIKEEAAAAGFNQTVSFDIPFSILEKKLDYPISEGSFLSGNITFCNIIPMRTIPFKVITLMGMDEASFPRQAFRPNFDLMQADPRAGDKAAREEQRYLFLETLLSAREKLIITYTGISIQDNSPLPCAGVVSELMDTMDNSFVFKEEHEIHFSHPLHAFSASYFSGHDRLFSYSRENCLITKALAQNQFLPQLSGDVNSDGSHNGAGRSTFLQEHPPVQNLEPPPSDIPLSDLITFFRNPVQWYVQKRLNIDIPRLEEASSERESFVLSGLDQYQTGNYLLHEKTQPSDTDNLYEILKAAGSLPLGNKGVLEYKRIFSSADPVIQAIKEQLSLPSLPMFSGTVTLDELTLSGTVSTINQETALNFGYGKLNANRLLTAWIHHLFLNAGSPESYPKKSVVIGRPPTGKKPVQIIEFSPVGEDSHQYLKSLLDGYLSSREKLFCFSGETSWALVQFLSRKNYDTDPESIFSAMTNPAVQKKWYGQKGPYGYPGDIDNPYLSLCFKNNDPFQQLETLLSSGLIDNSLNVFQPLLAHMETLS